MSYMDFLSGFSIGLSCGLFLASYWLNFVKEKSKMSYAEAREILSKAQKPLVTQNEDGTYSYKELVTDSEILEALAVMKKLRERD
jgi:hypothetical protein